jgi:hypothetical protein
MYLYIQWGVESLRASPIHFLSEKPSDFLPPTVAELAALRVSSAPAAGGGANLRGPFLGGFRVMDKAKIDKIISSGHNEGVTYNTL